MVSPAKLSEGAIGEDCELVWDEGTRDYASSLSLPRLPSRESRDRFDDDYLLERTPCPRPRRIGTVATRCQRYRAQQSGSNLPATGSIHRSVLRVEKRTHHVTSVGRPTDIFITKLRKPFWAIGRTGSTFGSSSAGTLRRAPNEAAPRRRFEL